MKLRLGNTVVIGMAALSISVLWQAYNWLVPLYLYGYLRGLTGGNEFLIGVVMGLDNLFAVAMLPFVTALSDRHKRETGSRMKLIALGVTTAGAAFCCLPLVRYNLFLMLLTLAAVLTAMNLYRAPAAALMPDVTPPPLRGKANAVINIMGGAGTALGYVLLFGGGQAGVDSGFVVCAVAAVMFFCLAVLLFKTDETPPLPSALLPAPKEKKTAPAENKKGRFFVLAAVFFYFMAVNAVETFMSIYSVRVLGDSTAGLTLMAALAAGSFAFLYPAAALAQKVGAKNVMLCGACLMSVGGVACSLFPSPSASLPAFFLIGVGMAFMVANMYPLVLSFCGKDDFARYTGYYYAATMLAQTVTPALAGLLFSPWLLGSMRALMPYSSLFMILAAAALYFAPDDVQNSLSPRI